MLLQYAERLPIGLKDVIEGVPATTVRAFYERWYRPENMAVVIAGDFDPPAVEKLLKSALSSCSWRSSAPAAPVPRQACLQGYPKTASAIVLQSTCLCGLLQALTMGTFSHVHHCCNHPLLICMTQNEAI